MAVTSSQRMKIIYVMKLFLEKTDKNHYVTMGDILGYLKNKGITAERKSIYADIDVLKQCGFDIRGFQKKGTYLYHLVNHRLELAELALIEDAVLSSKHIPAGKSEELIQKIRSLATDYEIREIHKKDHTANNLEKAKSDSVISPKESKPHIAHMIDIESIDKSEIETFLHSGASGGAQNAVEAFFQSIGSEQLKSSLFRLYIGIDIYLMAKRFMESIGVTKEIYDKTVGNTEIVIQQLRSQEAIKNYIIDLLEKCVKMRADQNDTKKTAINKAKEYISKHFHEPDISLGSVASAVNICAPHFCSLFKKETGETFVSFLTNLRMEKAKELLCCTTKRIAQIANEVGYNDYHYFTSLFKKLNGLKPCEFRKLNSENSK